MEGYTFEKMWVDLKNGYQIYYRPFPLSGSECLYIFVKNKKQVLCYRICVKHSTILLPIVDSSFQLPQSLLQRSTRTGNIQPHKPFTFFAERRSFIQSQVGFFYKQAIQFLLI